MTTINEQIEAIINSRQLIDGILSYKQVAEHSSLYGGKTLTYWLIKADFDETEDTRYVGGICDGLQSLLPYRTWVITSLKMRSFPKGQYPYDKMDGPMGFLLNHVSIIIEPEFDGDVKIRLIFSRPNAPFSGVYYDPLNDRFATFH